MESRALVPAPEQERQRAARRAVRECALLVPLAPAWPVLLEELLLLVLQPPCSPLSVAFMVLSRVSFMIWLPTKARPRAKSVSRLPSSPPGR